MLAPRLLVFCDSNVFRKLHAARGSEWNSPERLALCVERLASYPSGPYLLRMSDEADSSQRSPEKRQSIKDDQAQ
ncbi:hypothetical protein KOW79_007977 [Hemibagrus wyckioides]|uniref:Uncharacterized protein n=1 Tax=Hemibagrus wyckioides TaxID=337641 RepID=A0A9D3NVE0_9TELE|nr:hypothetical protein KOW79_007977 [Hemibagrus wyckioides]